MKMTSVVVGVLVFSASIALESQPAAPNNPSCDRLAGASLPSTAVTMARVEPAGPFSPPGGAKPLNAPRSFCRVAATLTPSADSKIAIEVWLPENWNGKFQAVGNGAFSGDIAYPAMMNALARGYATASTDTGHSGNTGSFALGHPEKVIDFGWRAVHEMTVTAKALVASYYERPANRSYWTGCSAGGRQGMKAAQRFPADFDGIVAGAPGLDWTGRAARAVEVAQALEKNADARLSPAQTRLLNTAALNACDAGDGVKDGVIDDPTRCAFDPSVLRCKGAADDTCLSSAQVAAAKLTYSAQKNPKTQRPIAGLHPGSELGWTELGWTASARGTGLDQFRFIVFKDPRWTIQQFDFATDIVRADDGDEGIINALDPNLKPFLDRGGKLIQYHGWSDPQISPGNSVHYYDRAAQHLGGASRLDHGYRLFMVPGMGHCGGGSGPNTFDMLTALERWVEQGTAPPSVIATRATAGVVDRSRPLCPYPQVALYRGTGDTNDAASFTCGVRR
ncbi:MAG: tannase/feruloyl esterase family alpha/beta hydrolase [Acidimicrobiia bacterium]|nr:tannase/feruloyl esterase family alpha/beta hydrolase [Acidimicrobiia bacterium]